jgi:hypothetical protein
MQYLLVDALVNIRRELKFFEDVAGRYGLDINIPVDDVSEGVRAYRALFAEMGEGVEARTFDFVEALVLLWGTEKVCHATLEFSFSPLSACSSIHSISFSLATVRNRQVAMC